MKRNCLILMAIAFILSFSFLGCKKDTPETITPKIINDKVETTATTATFTWTVDWVGNRVSVVEVSENEDMSHSQFYGSEEELNKSEFIVTANDLQPATKYYYRFLVWNQNYLDHKFVMGTKWFITDSDLPKVTTLPVSEVTWTTAKGGGDVTDDCGSEVMERGICWSENPKPTVSDQHLPSGSGTGDFTVQMEDLEPNKTYYVRAYAKNAKGIGYGEDESFITNETLLPEVTTAEVTDIAWRTAIGCGEVISENGATVTERGVCWSTEHDPTISGSHANNGSGLGSFSVNMTGLTAGTTYYVKAYAKNDAGLKYGDEVFFTTPDAVAPVVSTAAVTSISYTTATGGGNVTSDGGSNVTKQGICWSKDHDPVYEGQHLTIGSGVGSFTGQMTGLDDGTTYYVKAYAKNDVGMSYGEEVTFTTLTIAEPTVTTTSITNVEWTEATGKGKVTDNGGTAIIERGFCWSATNDEPTIADNYADTTSTTTTYKVIMTNLQPGTTYHARAYAKNSKKTGYGSVMTFKTKEIDAPTVTIENIVAIMQRQATGRASITSNGGLEVTEKGFCWGLEANPDFEDNHVVSNSTLTTFTADMQGLEPNTTYHVRAYAKNEHGTGWSADATFTTLPIQVPSLSITNVVHDHISATISCEIYNTGGADIIERGVCWSTNPNHMPDVGDEHISIEGGDNTFQIEITGLESNTNYYVRAYAKNNGVDEPGYSSFTTFKTYPEYYEILTGPTWVMEFVEGGHDCERTLDIYTDGTIEYYVYDNDLNDYLVEADWDYSSYTIDGSTIGAYYGSVWVWTENGFYHGFTNDVPITVTYQVISCTMNELVIKESLENKTWHLHPDNGGKHKPSKKRHPRPVKE